MADPYADALGIATAAPSSPPSGGSDPYADALGISRPIIRAVKKQLPPDFQTEDPAAFRQKLVASGNKEVLAQFDQQYSTVKPSEAPATAASKGIPTGMNPDGSMKYATPTTPQLEAPKSWWDKVSESVRGAAEAGLSTVVGGTAGAVAGAMGAVNNIAGTAANIVAGTPAEEIRKRPTVEQAYQFASEAAQRPFQPSTEKGKQYAANVGQALNESGLVAVAPLAQTQSLAQAAPAATRAISDATNSSMDAARASFQAKQGAVPVAARVEPVFDKPRYVQVNGEWQIKNPELPGGAPEVAASVKPSLETASPELQQVAAAAAKKAPLPADVLQRHVEADSLPVPMRLTAGQATLDPKVISDEMNNRAKNPALAEVINGQGKQLVQNIDAIKEAAAPDAAAANHVEAGQSLVDLYKKVDEPVRADISAKYQALKDANGGQFPLDGKAFVDSADAALKKDLKSHYVPAGIRSTLDDIRAGGGMTFEDFETLRSDLASTARSAADGKERAAANIIRQSLEDMPLTPAAQGLKPLADAARSAAKARFDRIEADPAYAAVVRDQAKSGDLSPLADSFIQQYVVKGKAANVAKMSENLASEPLARQVAAAGAIDYLSKKAGADPATGLFSQSGYNNAWKELSPKQAFLFDPQTGQHLETLGRVAKYTQVQPRGSYVNNSNTFVAGLANQAAGAAETVGNMAVPFANAGTRIRSALANRAAQQAVESHTAPGAGLTKIKDFPK